MNRFRQLTSYFTFAFAIVAAPLGAQPLSLDEALRVGEEQAPRLLAQRAMVTSAGHQAARAGELPDPRLRLGIENLPITGTDKFRYDRDFMTMRSIGWMQEFPNAAKRSARGARAERARDVEQATLTSQRAMLHREITLAWFDVHFAERTRDALEVLVRSFAAQADAVAASVVRGRSSAADSFMLRSALEQTRDRVIDQERMISRARIALAAFLGEEAKRPLGAASDTGKLAYSREALLARLQQLPQLRVFDERESLARAEIELARSMKSPDWSLEVGYSQRRPVFDNMLTAMVAIELPWQAERRQDKDIASKLAEADQVRAQREDARRTHEAEIRGWFADYDTAGTRFERFERVLLPLARERVAAALAAYRGGRGELAGVLEANRALVDTELGLIAVKAERSRAWTNLGLQYPHEVTK